VFRASNNTWYLLNSGSGTSSARQWGNNTDALVPGDYNGDGRTEVAVQRGAEGNWYVPQCGVNAQMIQKFGASGDLAVPSTLIP
jgi:spore coat protein A, manganese oxidase